MNNFPLNEGQQYALDKMVSYVTNPKYPFKYQLLQGPAGTGKTSVLAAFVEYLKSIDPGTVVPKYRIGLSAPTHKAVKQMRKHRIEGVEYATVHSALGMRLERNTTTGKDKYVVDKFNKDKMVDRINVWIIDEISMQADEIDSIITKLKLWRGDLKVIYVGDAAQIPPVGHIDSRPLLTEKQVEYKIEVLNLTKIERQGPGSPIIDYASYIRQQIIRVEQVMVPNPIPGVLDVYNNNPARVKEWLHDNFTSNDFKKDADFCKAIAWQNSTTGAINKIIRGEIYEGQTITKLMPGEKLVMNAALKNEYDKIVLNNSEELIVDEAEEKVMTIRYDTMIGEELDERVINIKYYDTLVEYDSMQMFGMVSLRINIIHEEEESRWNVLLEKVRHQALTNWTYRSELWRSYWRLKEMFADVGYNYSITSHKSQGSTYTNALVMFWDINMQFKYDRNRNPRRTLTEVNRIKYTSVTRPSNSLVIVP